MLRWLATKFERRRAGLQARLENALTASESNSEPVGSAEWRKRGNALLDEDRLSEALVCYRFGVQADPNDAACYVNLGFVLGELGRPDESQEMLQKAVALNSADFDSHYMLGNLARSRGELPAAIESYQRALAAQPDFEVCRRDLCLALAQAGRTREARMVLEAGRAFEPDGPEYHFFSGNLHLADSEIDAAVASFLRATQLKPLDASLLINLGVAQFRQRDVFSSVATYQRILEFEPTNVQAHANIAAAFQMSGQLELAIQSYRKALQINPEYLNAHQNLLYALTYDSQCSPAEYLLEAKRYGARVTARAKCYSQWLCPEYSAEIRPLRVGFVSGDLRTHPVGIFLEAVLACIDPTKLTLLAYSNCALEDELSARIRPFFAEWSRVDLMSDEALAKKIYNDKVDVLVDLAGHTEKNRLSLFAWRPAPLQVAWLGYWASTGVAEIDFILVDQVSVPESSQQFFCEKTWYLPETRFCFTPPAELRTLVVSSQPADRNGYVTFGSFQMLNKMSDSTLSAWSKVLKLIPMARLRLQNWELGYPDAAEKMRVRLHSCGVDLNRVDFYGGVSRAEYLASYSEVDMILDTFPFPGGTTTVEALWMGVPTITLTGNTLVSRQGESLLRCIGLGNWVASTEPEYVELALSKANDFAGLSELRKNIRGQLLNSPLVDARLFSKNLEKAFVGMVTTNASGFSSIG